GPSCCSLITHHGPVHPFRRRIATNGTARPAPRGARAGCREVSEELGIGLREVRDLGPDRTDRADEGEAREAETAGRGALVESQGLDASPRHDLEPAVGPAGAGDHGAGAGQVADATVCEGMEPSRRTGLPDEPL